MIRLLTITGPKTAQRIAQAIMRAPIGSRVELYDPQRSLEQNAKMWVLLGEWARQKEHCGRYYVAEQWKAILLHAMGQEIQMLPALDGNDFIPFGGRTSKMTTAQMSEFIEFIIAEGTKRGVVFDDELRKPGQAA